MDEQSSEAIIDEDDDEKLFAGEENELNHSSSFTSSLENQNEKLEEMVSEEMARNSKDDTPSNTIIKPQNDSLGWWSGIGSLLSPLKNSDFATPLVLTGLLSFVAGSLLSFSFSNLKSRQTNDEMKSRILSLENSLKEKQYELHLATDRLNKEIQISKAASQHNISLNKQKEYFETQFNIQSRNLNLANQQIEKYEETISKCREKIEDLERQIESYKNNITHLEGDLKDHQLVIQDLNLKINHLENQVKENERMIEKQKQRIVNLKETHKIFEYVLTKASPQLAERIINQIHRVQNIEDETDEPSKIGRAIKEHTPVSNNDQR
ncbi:hypothetical protein FDP41_004805 [Naegleria fowleri]|uniref:Uncharacterized protein n=1 Tax=Naegleria fowleri TaxID=5763 RepID=A0A6A5BQK2_NAEFO|nr:uncharacterized protein FDP41_004805 [Naegleria fowleri]KAF0976130.1 hypothetical protein FDP41_004805 [Naegleria fowleri]CAG4711150.1 unnamed protein product [Naegleria fowleri]